MARSARQCPNSPHAGWPAFGLAAVAAHNAVASIRRSRRTRADGFTRAAVLLPSRTRLVAEKTLRLRDADWFLWENCELRHSCPISVLLTILSIVFAVLAAGAVYLQRPRAFAAAAASGATIAELRHAGGAGVAAQPSLHSPGPVDAGEDGLARGCQGRSVVTALELLVESQYMYILFDGVIASL